MGSNSDEPIVISEDSDGENSAPAPDPVMDKALAKAAAHAKRIENRRLAQAAARAARAAEKDEKARSKHPRKGARKAQTLATAAEARLAAGNAEAAVAAQAMRGSPAAAATRVEVAAHPPEPQLAGQVADLRDKWAALNPAFNGTRSGPRGDDGGDDGGDDDAVFAGERMLKERNADDFANVIVIDDDECEADETAAAEAAAASAMPARTMHAEEPLWLAEQVTALAAAVSAASLSDATKSADEGADAGRDAAAAAPLASTAVAQAAAAPTPASALAPPPVPAPPRSWTSAFEASPSDALRRFGSTPCAVLLVVLEGNDPASLHLLKAVWPDRQIGTLLHSPRVIPLRVDGGRDPLAAAFWASELGAGGVLPTIVLAYGARGLVCVRERRLQPTHLLQKLDEALSAAEAASVAPGLSSTSAALSATSARAAGMLARYDHAASRQFRPPTPPPTQQELDQLAREQDRLYAADLDAAYAASLRADEAADEAADRERAAVEARRAAEEARRDEERARLVQAAEAAARRREARLAAASALPAEPSANEHLEVASIAVRLRDGRRMARRFDSSAPLQMVLDWVGGFTPDAPGPIRLASHYPRRVFEAEETASSLASLALDRGAALFVEEDDGDDEDEE